jgi:SAM-dependent methyltransferase
MSDDQFELGRKLAAERGLTVSFHRGSAYELPFEDWSFDAVFAHALLEHLRDPVGALSEMGRVLRPGGLIGACSPDWGGFIVTPPSDALSAALADYRALKTANGWNPLAGRYLGEWMLAASLTDVRLGAYYEQYTDRTQIASLLGEQLNAGGRARSADTLRSWLNEPGAMFAQAWVYAVGRGRNQFSGRPARPGVPSQTSL